ncbi:hypothetical protein GCM10009601_15880 [Streptomyces thermospinosisporus]|uniref:MoxR domain-containing protein n=1 Tax=Streptomyces thermospinosisporus TaxID=161482 RepID=A0ABN1YP83_9ACTN
MRYRGSPGPRPAWLLQRSGREGRERLCGRYRGEEPGMGDGQETARRLRAVREELAERFLERDDVVRTLVVTLPAGQHSLLLGPPGTATSELARELTGRIEGAAYWEILLPKCTAPTRMSGPIDVAAPARGEYRQVYDGRATTAHIAFSDEIFKCSTAALNETPGHLNERICHPESGGAPREISENWRACGTASSAAWTSASSASPSPPPPPRRARSSHPCDNLRTVHDLTDVRTASDLFRLIRGAGRAPVRPGTAGRPGPA